ncbi:DUF1830 domain-containing protein (plasmid) [Acaryochloris sp. 'Moss Beach']|uniref:DUF1830 domain-containing protein n=1 Tax=Acaryochloris TaxID=155977 RepID=UPI001BAFBCC3|nr:MULTISPECIES: DUF1830 domain-containing protein [Acaryochloris]QUY45870.1 DUF1830 domain-containing protein [Acaryochloris marina S15]UJB72486.1 DUF1830 domain-containing protein [Acaryochloris sp. 'Moss Beach']
MIKTLEPQQSEFVFCSYRNSTSRVQVLRVTNVENWYFERVIFPQQYLIFNAPRKAHLEVHSSEIATAIQVDCIPCKQLTVKAT